MARLLYVVTEDWYFCSHRLPLAIAALRAGFEVAVATNIAEHREQIESAGIKVIPVKFSRSGRHLLKDLFSILSLINIYKRERPHLVHHVSLKPVLYGSIAARFAGISHVVNALTGLGYVFSSESGKVRFIRSLVSPMLRYALAGSGYWTLFQNADDARTLTQDGILNSDRSLIIRGSGVNLSEFDVIPGTQSDNPTVLLPARMLGDKGVREFVQAARLIQQKGIKSRFVLAGGIDTQNPSAVSRHEIDAWTADGVVEWLGECTDMVTVYNSAHIVCLPSYREGLPKSLLEAAACGLPLIATNVPGCREVVRDGDNGFLVPPRDAQALADAIERLILDTDMRVRMGTRSRAMAEAEFGIESVIEQTLSLYDKVLKQ